MYRYVIGVSITLHGLYRRCAVLLQAATDIGLIRDKWIESLFDVCRFQCLQTLKITFRSVKHMLYTTYTSGKNNSRLMPQITTVLCTERNKKRTASDESTIVNNSTAGGENHA